MNKQYDDFERINKQQKALSTGTPKQMHTCHINNNLRGPAGGVKLKAEWYICANLNDNIYSNANDQNHQGIHNIN